MADNELEYNSEGKKNNLTIGYFQVNPGLCAKTSLLPNPFRINGLTNVFTSLLPPGNSDHIMIHFMLGGYNCVICHIQLIAWEYVQTKQL